MFRRAKYYNNPRCFWTRDNWQRGTNGNANVYYPGKISFTYSYDMGEKRDVVLVEAERDLVADNSSVSHWKIGVRSTDPYARKTIVRIARNINGDYIKSQEEKK